MHKRFLYITIILAMLFGAFGMMGPGGVQEALADAENISGTLRDDYGAKEIYDLSTPKVAFGQGLVNFDRQEFDPLACEAGVRTAWVEFTTTQLDSETETETEFMTVVLRPEFNGVVVVTEVDDLDNEPGAVVDCFNVAADKTGMLTIEVKVNTEYSVMIAERQGYPYADAADFEKFDLFVMQSEFETPVIVENLVPDGSYQWQTPSGLPLTLIFEDISTFDIGGEDIEYAFFDLPAGPNHLSWTKDVVAEDDLGLVFFETLEGPLFVEELDVNELATAEVQVTAGTEEGAVTALTLVPSEWDVAPMSVDYNYMLGTVVPGCDALEIVEGTTEDQVLCTFKTVPGTYDAHLESTDPNADHPYYLLTIQNALFDDVILQALDFRASKLDQATVQLNEDVGEQFDIELAVRVSEALGDRSVFRTNEEQLIITSDLITDIEVRLHEQETNTTERNAVGQTEWLYALDPIFFEGLDAPEAVSRVFGPDEEVNITLAELNDDDEYVFSTSIDFNSAVTAVETTDYVDAMGNVLVGVFAPVGTLDEGILLDEDELDNYDTIIPNTWVAYGTKLNDVINEFTWMNGPLDIPETPIGRYYAQRALLTGEKVIAGISDVEDVFEILGYDDSGQVTGVKTIGANSPADTTSGSHWAWSWIMAMYEKGLTTGVDPMNYAPQMDVTRAEMATFLARLMVNFGLEPTGLAPDFDDVPESHWAYESIMLLRDYDITNGIGDNLYGPDQNVTRAEMAKFIQVLFREVHFQLGYNPTYWDTSFATIISPQPHGLIFADVPSSNWAVMFIEELFLDNLTDGCDRDGLTLYYCPDNNVTRGEMAKFIIRAIQEDEVTKGFWPFLAPEK